MVRNIVVFGLSSHEQLAETICNHLGIPPAKILLGKFAVGETRVEIKESVRGKDVFIIQTGGGKVNDHLMELLVTISACKTASAKRVTVVLPLFPYSRQSDIPYSKIGAPLAKQQGQSSRTGTYSFESRPQTPYPGQQESQGISNGADKLHQQLNKLRMNEPRNGGNAGSAQSKESERGETVSKKRSDTLDSHKSGTSDYFSSSDRSGRDGEDSFPSNQVAKMIPFQPQRGYRQWVAQAGTLVADLLTCAGADHIITMDLHDPQYQGFFDIPVDNLYGRHLLRRYIQYQIPNYQQAVIVSPDAGGAKRATAIADSLSMPFALIHKVCKLVLQRVVNTNISCRNEDRHRSAIARMLP